MTVLWQAKLTITPMSFPAASRRRQDADIRIDRTR